jgi:hypothetical protein
VRGGGGVDEQEGIRPARGLAGCSVWPSAYLGCLQVTQPEAAPGLSVPGRFETGRRGTVSKRRGRPSNNRLFQQLAELRLDPSGKSIGVAPSLGCRRSRHSGRVGATTSARRSCSLWASPGRVRQTVNERSSPREMSGNLS